MSFATKRQREMIKSRGNRERGEVSELSRMSILPVLVSLRTDWESSIEVPETYFAGVTA